MATREQAAVAAVTAHLHHLDESGLTGGVSEIPGDLDAATLVVLCAHLVKLTGSPGREALARLGLAIAGHAVRRSLEAQ